MEVRLATRSDFPALGQALGRAFADDPVASHMIPDGSADRERRLGWLMGIPAKSALRHGNVYTTADREAAAVWLPPGKWRVPPLQQLATGPGMLRALRTRVPVALAMLSTIEAHHPAEPHWYLEILGTDPASQGRGIGAALMAPVLERCDAEGVPAYLESSKHSNIAYYERHGFRRTGEIQLPKGGPLAWPMWRDPQP